jgi:ribosomal-protein-alanine N-acetyltransferase
MSLPQPAAAALPPSGIGGDGTARPGGGLPGGLPGSDLRRPFHDAGTSPEPAPRDTPVPPLLRNVAPMTVADVDAVMAIEVLACAVPWTRGNFVDSIAAGHTGVLLTGVGGELLGYSMAMEGVDELHLLNLTVSPAHQRRGHARFLLDELARLARRLHARELWLEVRQSNDRARALYLGYGFAQVGVRKAYYPLPPGSLGREDAVVMSLKLPWTDDFPPSTGDDDEAGGRHGLE